jgi:gamma-glutamylaminecyclotransferase
MCIIIIKQKGKQVPQEVAKTSAKINPHGLGIIWLDTFEVSYHKSSEFKVLQSERPYIAHFRYATVGAINKENTHPFRCGKNQNEWLMMNGTIQGLGNAHISDSRALANNLGEIPRQNWKAELEKYTCRFVTINSHSKTYQIYNKDLWTQKDGVWYSKEVVQDNLIAVYGTLKRGYGNYYNYLSSSKFIGKGNTKDKYPLIISGLPYLINKKGEGHNVQVDVFKVTDSKLNDLDRLEGHPNWYRREKIEIKVKGVVLSCWIYFNIRETETGKPYHKTYFQNTKPKTVTKKLDIGWGRGWDKYGSGETLSMFDNYKAPAKTIYEEPCDDCDFNIKDEKPICVNCYQDLEHDAFSNYHCCGCDEWFTESEVVRCLF